MASCSILASSNHGNLSYSVLHLPAVFCISTTHNFPAIPAHYSVLMDCRRKRERLLCSIAREESLTLYSLVIWGSIWLPCMLSQYQTKTPMLGSFKIFYDTALPLFIVSSWSVIILAGHFFKLKKKCCCCDRLVRLLVSAQCCLFQIVSFLMDAIEAWLIILMLDAFQLGYSLPLILCSLMLNVLATGMPCFHNGTFVIRHFWKYFSRTGLGRARLDL